MVTPFAATGDTYVTLVTPLTELLFHYVFVFL